MSASHNSFVGGGFVCLNSRHGLVARVREIMAAGQVYPERIVLQIVFVCRHGLPDEHGFHIKPSRRCLNELPARADSAGKL